MRSVEAVEGVEGNLHYAGGEADCRGATKASHFGLEPRVHVALADSTLARGINQDHKAQGALAADESPSLIPS